APDFSNVISPTTCQYKYLLLNSLYYIKTASDTTDKVTANTKAPMDASAPGISSKCSSCQAFSALN
ncbi:MAG: hypothetical protein WBZ05_14070, partial [Desulfobacterales bacterium]